MATSQAPLPTTEKVITLRISSELDAKAAAAAESVNLKKSDVIRLSIDRGIDVLLDQLKSQPAA